MGLNPQSEAVNTMLLNEPFDAASPIAEQRAHVARVNALLARPAEPVAEVRELTLPGPGGELAARAYRPRASRPAGVLVWLHGGGFAFGSLDETEHDARALALACDCLVVTVDYRLAPEHPFPAGAEDSYAAVTWVAEHLGELDAEGLPVAVGGESAGGSLAAAVTLMTRDRGGPSLALQLLVYPMTCCAPLDLASRREHADGLFATMATIESLWDAYLPQGGGDHPYASPLLAESVAGLPPAIVVTAEYDVLCDEGERYAMRLVAAGVPVTARRFLGVLHAFLGQDAYVDDAGEAFAWIGAQVQGALPPGTGTAASTPRGHIGGRGAA